jgi:hypothetical protein
VLGALAAPWFTVVVSLAAVLLVAGIRWAGRMRADWARRVLRVRTIPIFLILFFMVLRGPQYVWFLFWTSDAGRAVLCIAIMISLVGHAVLLFEQPPRRRLAGGLLALGALLAMLGGTAWAVGLEASMTALNEELMLLPGMLSRVLGIVTHLDIPPELGVWMLAGGCALIVVALVIQPREPNRVIV